MNDQTGPKTPVKRTLTHAHLLRRQVASFAVPAPVGATAAVTFWLWSYLDMERAIGLP
jgi:hypothetical protein